jgi:hypothetical protein
VGTLDSEPVTPDRSIMDFLLRTPLVLYATISAAGLLMLACGSSGPPAAAPVQLISAQVCAQGEERATVVYVRNLDDFAWGDVAVTVTKGDLDYTKQVLELVSESTEAAAPFTNSLDFAFDDPGGSAPSKVTGEQVHERRPLHNFGNLASARIVVTTPYPGEWKGEVPPCS